MDWSERLLTVVGPGASVSGLETDPFTGAGLTISVPEHFPDKDEVLSIAPNHPCRHGEGTGCDCVWCHACWKWSRDNGAVDENGWHYLSCMHRTGWRSEP
jgi:hypothetical protein